MELSLSSLTLQLRFSRCFSHAAGWSMGRTWPEYTLYYIINGAVCFDIMNSRRTACAGDSVFLFPGDFGNMSASEDCSFLIISFHVDVGNYHHLFFRLNSAGVYRSPAIAAAGAALLGAFVPESANPLRFSPRQYGALAVFLAELMEQPELCAPFHRPAPEYADWKLNSLLARMDAAAPELLPIQTLAEEMQMSEKYFIQYFRKQIGITPGQYMNRLRMEYAAQLLTDTSLPLEAAAQKLGYADRYSFSKAFRKYYGEAPGAFRSHVK